MLRFLCWKIGIEWAHLLRALWPQTHRRVFYFAFGANLSPAVLQQRKIRVYDAFDFVLENAALRFTQPGFYHGHGYASADAAEGHYVYGRIYQILARDALRMDYFEGAPVFKVHQKIFHQSGQMQFFFYRTTRIVEGLRPTREYLDYLLEAYRRMPAVPRKYVETIAATEVLEALRPLNEARLFVRNPDVWPQWLRPWLIIYERVCMKLVEFFWHRSLLQCLIRN